MLNEGFLFVVMLGVYADIFHDGSVQKALPHYLTDIVR